MELKLENLSESTFKEAFDFLNRYDTTSLFLLGNLHEHGSKLTAHPNSGNFKLIRHNGEVRGVFCLTRRGNLLVQSELIEPTFDIILSSCKQEPIQLRGILGDWDFANEFWVYLKDRGIIINEVYHSREINYALRLDTWEGLSVKEARVLTPQDYDEWKPLRIAYLKEQKLPQDISDNEMQQQFIENCAKSKIWGLFIDSKMISTAGLNAKTDTLATVGGVYTVPHFRKRGFAKALMTQLILDCKHKLVLQKLIIFTGEKENLPAQRLYESLGSQKIGYMALFSGE